jgi:hypothetical protein
MVSILIAGLVFTITLIIHILVSRIFRLFGIKTMKLLLIFGLGLIVFNRFFVSIIQPVSLGYKGLFFVPLPISAIFFYILLFMFYLIYYLSTYSGETGPSIKLYLIMRRYGKRSLSQIQNEFPEKDFIHKRLASLVNSGFIIKNNRIYTASPQGKRFVQLIGFYRFITGWKLGG